MTHRKILQAWLKPTKLLQFKCVYLTRFSLPPLVHSEQFGAMQSGALCRLLSKTLLMVRLAFPAPSRRNHWVNWSAPAVNNRWRPRAAASTFWQDGKHHYIVRRCDKSLGVLHVTTGPFRKFALLDMKNFSLIVGAYCSVLLRGCSRHWA